jgi:hypothetical protein
MFVCFSLFFYFFTVLLLCDGIGCQQKRQMLWGVQAHRCMAAALLNSLFVLIWAAAVTNLLATAALSLVCVVMDTHID